MGTWRAPRSSFGSLLFEGTENEPYTYVWRLQDRQGYGPYNSVLSQLYLIHNSENRPYEQPDPFKDFDSHEWVSNPDRKMYLFGFRKPEGAEEWFGTDMYKKLLSFGLKLKKMKAKKVFLSRSGRQVIFLPYTE